MKIQAGKFYRLRNGEVVGPIKRLIDGVAAWTACGLSWYERGSYYSNASSSEDIVSEVLVVPVLPFELKAGGKYDTQKPDGSLGPVVTLGVNSYAKSIAPFYFKLDGTGEWWVTSAGFANRYCCNKEQETLQIVSEHVEPPKPTAIERLEQSIELLASARQNKDDEAFALIRGVIAEMKAENATP